MSHDKNFIGNVLDKDYDVITFFSKLTGFKKAESNQFTEIIKIAIAFTETTLKDSKKNQKN